MYIFSHIYLLYNQQWDKKWLWLNMGIHPLLRCDSQEGAHLQSGHRIAGIRSQTMVMTHWDSIWIILGQTHYWQESRGMSLPEEQSTVVESDVVYLVEDPTQWVVSRCLRTILKLKYQNMFCQSDLCTRSGKSQRFFARRITTSRTPTWIHSQIWPPEPERGNNR